MNLPKVALYCGINLLANPYTIPRAAKIRLHMKLSNNIFLWIRINVLPYWEILTLYITILIKVQFLQNEIKYAEINYDILKHVKSAHA